MSGLDETKPTCSVCDKWRLGKVDYKITYLDRFGGRLAETTSERDRNLTGIRLINNSDYYDKREVGAIRCSRCGLITSDPHTVAKAKIYLNRYKNISMVSYEEFSKLMNEKLKVDAVEEARSEIFNRSSNPDYDDFAVTNEVCQRCGMFIHECDCLYDDDDDYDTNDDDYDDSW